MRSITILLLLVASCCCCAQLHREESPLVYTVEQVNPVKPGETFNVDVDFKIGPSWHIYAPTGVNEEQGMIEAKLLLTAPSGFSKTGRIKTSETSFKEGFEVLSGDATLTQGFKALPGVKPGKYVIKGKLSWQSCSDAICLPPQTEEISATVVVQ